VTLEEMPSCFATGSLPEDLREKADGGGDGKPPAPTQRRTPSLFTKKPHCSHYVKVLLPLGAAREGGLCEGSPSHSI